MSIFDQLQAACLPHLEAYRDDLVKHDKEIIANRHGVPFVHVTRANGTHICFMPSAADYPAPGVYVPYLFGTANRDHVLEQVVTFVDYWLRPCAETVKAVYWFDGQRLRKIDLEKAQKLLRDYGRRVRDTWRRADFEIGVGCVADGVTAAVA